EPTGRDAAGGPAAAVLDVRNIGLHQLAVVLPERQRPYPPPPLLSGRADLVDQSLVAAHDTCRGMSQGDDDRPREGGDVDHRGRVVAAGIGESVAENEPAFR